MALSINRTNALLGIERTPSRLEIHTQKAMLEQKRNPARMSIKTERPTVLIDQYEAFASSGLKNNYDREKEIAQRAYQQVLQTISSKAEDGDRLAAIESGGNPIADIAERDAWPEHEFGMDTMPKAGPSFEVTGSIDIDWNVEETVNAVESNFIPGEININFQPSVVRLYMRQYASLEIRYIGENIDVAI